MTFDQAPCDYTQTYEVTVIDKNTGKEIDVPGFITPDGDVIIFDTPAGVDIGDYEV